MTLTELHPDRTADAPTSGAAAVDADLPTRAQTPARVAAWVAVLAVIVAVFVAPGGGDGFAPGEFARVVDGPVQVRDGTTWRTVPVGGTIRDGMVLRSQDDHARLAVRGGSLSLSRWAQLEAAADTIGLTRGELLLEADRTYTVRLGAVEGRGRGSWRVSVSGLERVGVYTGGAAVSGPGIDEPLEVPRLREVPLTAGGVDDVQPLRYLPSDTWDERLLAEAIRVDEVLARTERALAVRYGTALQPAAFYADFVRFEGFEAHLPQLAVRGEAPEGGEDGEDGEDGELFGPPAATLIAVIVADLLVTRAGLAPAEAAERIDRLRTAGAPWGLIVVQHDLTAADLDRTLDRAVRRRGEAVESGTATRPRGPAREPERQPETPSPRDDDGDRRDDPGPSPSPSPPPPDPEDDPDPGEPEEPEEEPGTLDPVEDQVDDVGSLLDEVVPGASEVTDEVNEVIDTVDDLLPPPPAPLDRLVPTEPLDDVVPDLTERLLP